MDIHFEEVFRSLIINNSKKSLIWNEYHCFVLYLPINNSISIGATRMWTFGFTSSITLQMISTVYVTFTSPKLVIFFGGSGYTSTANFRTQRSRIRSCASNSCVLNSCFYAFFYSYRRISLRQSGCFYFWRPPGANARNSPFYRGFVEFRIVEWIVRKWSNNARSSDTVFFSPRISVIIVSVIYEHIFLTR